MSKSKMIVRTKFVDRACHWTVVICFFLVALSGISFFFPTLQWLTQTFGTPQMGRILHPFFGIAIFIALMCRKWLLSPRRCRVICSRASLMRCATISSWTDNDEPNTMTGFFMPARRVLREIVCRIAGANQQNSRSVTAGKGSNLWARSFLTCTNPAALTCLLNVLVHLT